VVIAVTLIVSFAISLTGDPAVMLAQGAGSITEVDLERIREALGLNQSFLAQYIGFQQGLVVDDFGRSFGRDPGE